MRGFVSTLAASAASDKDAVKEVAPMASRLKSLDERPEEELPQDQIDAIFEKLGLDGGIKLGLHATNTTTTTVSPGCSRQEKRNRSRAGGENRNSSRVLRQQARSRHSGSLLLLLLLTANKASRVICWLF